MNRLSGKVALITGGTSGIGEATVRRFVDEGASVVFTGRNVEAGRKLTEDTGAHFEQQQVEDADGWPALIDKIKSEFGRLDTAFANAGMEGGDTDIENVTMDAWDKIVAVNMTGPMLTAKHAIELMKANPEGSGGSIILNSSMNGILALPGNVGYSTTKGALRLLAKSVAVHCALKNLNIRCNSVHPGVIETALIKGAIDASPDPKAARGVLEGLSPMKRMGTPEEVAGLCVYLASDEAAFVTGAEYIVDGGSTAGLVGV
jgi:NAD(P)-dependent dehydrogenase (short-subunit alcohol dehydrogenase family)